MSTAPTIKGTLSGQTTTIRGSDRFVLGYHARRQNFRAADTPTMTLSNSGAGRTPADGTGFTGIVADGSWKLKANRDGGDQSELNTLVFRPTVGQPNTTTTTTFRAAAT
jgi:hypothetical protein